jgi:hypothetical protein
MASGPILRRLGSSIACPPVSKLSGVGTRKLGRSKRVIPFDAAQVEKARSFLFLALPRGFDRGIRAAVCVMF